MGKIVDLRRRLIAEVLSFVLAVGVSGCAKLDAQTATQRNNFSTSAEEIDKQISTGFKYVLDFDYFDNAEIDIPETTSGKVIGHVYSNKKLKDPYSTLNIEWPSCFASYLSENSLEEMYDNFNITCIEEKLTADNQDIRVVETILVAKDDIKVPINNLPYDEPQESIHKGDTMESKAVYLLVDGEYYLVGFNQTGIGSNCSNVANKTVGDINLALTSINPETAPSANISK